MKKLILMCLLVFFNVSSAIATENPTAQSYLHELLKANVGIHQAFFKSEDKNLKSHWELFKKALDAKHPDSILELVSEAKKQAENFQSEPDFQKKRKLYAELLGPIVLLLQKFGPIAKFKIFTCPMLKKDWIQDLNSSSGVENPLAPEMPKCGMMRE